MFYTHQTLINCNILLSTFISFTCYYNLHIFTFMKMFLHYKNVFVNIKTFLITLHVL